jgi:hypothetical protein
MAEFREAAGSGASAGMCSDAGAGNCNDAGDGKAR